MKNYVVGIDAGTSIVKSVIFNLRLDEIAKTETKLEVETPQSEWSEIDMNRLWEIIKSSIKTSIKNSGIYSKEVAAVSITGQGSGCWMIDRDGNPVRKAIIWTDSRANVITNAWKKSGIIKKAFAICRSVQISGVQGPIVKWLKIHEPEALEKARHIFYCKDWIRYKFTGLICTDGSDTSQTLLDVARYNYSDELFNLYGIEEYRKLFPEIIPKTGIVGKLKPDIALEIGLEPEIPVVSAPLDGISSGIGVGCFKKGQAFTILGTTVSNDVIIDDLSDQTDCVGMTFCFGFKGLWIRSLNPMCGTPNIDWYIREFGVLDRIEANKEKKNLFEYLNSVIEKIPEGSLIYHPFLSPAGERAPFVKENARAQLFGLNYNHTRHHILKAIFEGMAFSIKDCYEKISFPVSEIMLSGGGAKDRVWPQIIANVTGKTIKTTSGNEFGAKGSALIALVSLGIYKSYDEAKASTIEINRIFKPDKNSFEKYSRIFKIYENIYKKMWNQWDYFKKV
ncbi:MAG: carbohydrate kinase [Actinobacteria bacterium]|nr:carbohydrate kinase [Actinomycetota bacterium]